jgi:UDP-2,4-diacetamido-2,4,6-trideoxy-beta-L-altropyranose hydrolase
MKVAIRADASAAIGSGHLMRCLCLADALREQGSEVLFVCHELPAPLAAQVAAHGHGLAVLPAPGEPGDPAPQKAWPGGRQGEDAAATLACLEGRAVDWLVADHYGLDRLWESRMRGAARQTMAIDDLAREHDCDLLLDQTFHPDPATRYANRVSAHATRLLGPSYALLRPEFQQARAQAAPREGEVRRLLVFMGGMDASNATGLVLQAVELLQRPELLLDVVIGPGHPARAAIQASCAARPGAVCHVQTQDMADLLARADLAIGAGGGATWERCALGVPALAFALADNQRELLASAARHGIVYVPDDAPDARTLAMHLNALLANTALRNHLSRRAFALVDGKGVQRVAAALCGAGVTVRPAAAADCAAMHEWRNAPAVRAASRNPREVSLQEHQRWFDEVLRSPGRCLLIGESCGAPVGVVRFDIDGAQAEVSIYRVEGRFGHGLGTGLLTAAEQWLLAHHPQVITLLAETLPWNTASQRLFERCGYGQDAIRFSKRISTP